MSDWILITDDIPNDGETVLADDGITKAIATFERKNLIDYVFIENEHFIFDDVQRWRRL